LSHWYDSIDGSPRYTVPYANGKGERATNLGDARKLKLVPSVTTILGIVDKPALTKWKMDQIIKAVLENPYHSFNCVEQWKRQIFSASQREGKEAADRGGAIHDVLEKYYLGKDLHPDFEDYCRPAIELLGQRFGKMAQWVPEASFSHKLGFGGKCDLHMLPCKDFPNGVIVDFKTKSARDFSKVKAYPEQCQQLVAYREGFGISKAECYNLFIGTNTPGELLLHEWDEAECADAWECFQHLVGYWMKINKFKINIDN
jgi:hypothetical protein